MTMKRVVSSLSLALLSALVVIGEAEAAPPSNEGQKTGTELPGIPGEPGSGVGRVVEGGGDPNRLQAPLPKRPRSPDEAQAIGELEEIYLRFELGAWGIAPALIGAVEKELNREGLSLGGIARAPIPGTLAALTTNALIGRTTGEKNGGEKKKAK